MGRAAAKWLRSGPRRSALDAAFCDMDWPTTLPPCPILRGVIDRVAAAGADHVERMWAKVGTYTYKCDICGTENVVQNYGDWACRQCLQGYTYDECHRISLTDAQWALLRNPPQWISVDERLPEEGVDVLVSWGSPESELLIAHWRADEQEWLDDHGKRVPAVRLTHWMPLPEPPEVK